MTSKSRQRRGSNARRTAAILSLFVCVLTSAHAAHASASVGTITDGHTFAFGNVGGYINFAAPNGGVTVTDAGLSGYAWSANDGWINLAPAQGGVRNDGNGGLSGSAWDETAGWVDFSGVTINASGQFHGQATGGTVSGASYAINFDCTFCDVETDWRPVSVRGGVVGQPLNPPQSPGSISPIVIPAAPASLPKSFSATTTPSIQNSGIPPVKTVTPQKTPVAPAKTISKGPTTATSTVSSNQSSNQKPPATSAKSISTTTVAGPVLSTTTQATRTAQNAASSTPAATPNPAVVRGIVNAIFSFFRVVFGL
jgi:hypothetical protein